MLHRLSKWLEFCQKYIAAHCIVNNISIFYSVFGYLNKIVYRVWYITWTAWDSWAPRSSQERVQKCLCFPGSNWDLEMLVFKERVKPENPEKNLSEHSREPTTNSTHIWHRVWESNPGHIGGRQALSPLRHPCSLLLLHRALKNNLSDWLVLWLWIQYTTNDDTRKPKGPLIT